MTLTTLVEIPRLIQGYVFEHGILPVLYAAGLMAYADDAFAGTGLAIVGALQVVAVWALLRPLEAWRPVEVWADRRAVRVDVLYTLLERMGLLALAFYILLRPLVEALDGALRLVGYIPRNLEDVLPGLAIRPVLAFGVYLLVLDSLEYARHRLQHRWRWWWGLHSIHHSQRQLSLWADDRNHLLDSAIAELWRAAAALLIGVPTAQFVLIVFLTRAIESLAHANVQLGFGRVGARLCVSPRYHRIHHGMGIGHEGPAHGVNFSSLFPVWDVLFRTGDFSSSAPVTGISDQLAGADYGRGFLSQQAQGLRRMLGALAPARATAPGPGSTSTRPSRR